MVKEDTDEIIQRCNLALVSCGKIESTIEDVRCLAGLFLRLTGNHQENASQMQRHCDDLRYFLALVIGDINWAHVHASKIKSEADEG